MWVAATVADYNSATLSSITDLYNAGSASDAIQVVDVDDVFIVLTSSGSYSIVRFTEVNEEAGNADNYVFAYKIEL